MPSATLSSLLLELPLVPVLRERVALVQEEYRQLERRLAECEQRGRELVAERTALQQKTNNLAAALADAQEELAAQATTKAEEYVTYRGQLFHRAPGGGFDPDCCCPKCYRPMMSLGDVMPYRCRPCGHDAPFTAEELPRILGKMVSLGL